MAQRPETKASAANTDEVRKSYVLSLSEIRWARETSLATVDDDEKKLPWENEADTDEVPIEQRALYRGISSPSLPSPHPRNRLTTTTCRRASPRNHEDARLSTLHSSSARQN